MVLFFRWWFDSALISVSSSCLVLLCFALLCSAMLCYADAMLIMLNVEFLHAFNFKLSYRFTSRYIFR